MAISKEKVKYVAHLARIELKAEEIKHFQKQLEVILEYIDKLKKLNVSQIEPTTHALEIENVCRPDAVRPSLDSQKVFEISPEHEGGFFKVPKVIE